MRNVEVVEVGVNVGRGSRENKGIYGKKQESREVLGKEVRSSRESEGKLV